MFKGIMGMSKIYYTNKNEKTFLKNTLYKK